ncbi:MAG: hypothetical protein LBE20_03720 [Deltaproteobacteria bacterium]|jgi:endoglucanase Acf2|nr:hypothetical protein [Deltaproteobacteria bacterium]
MKIYISLFLSFIPYWMVSAEIVNIKLNPPTEFDFKTREEIFAVRLSTIEQYPQIIGDKHKVTVFDKYPLTIFNTKLINEKYKISSSVFKHVIDNKPWWGLQGLNCLEYKGVGVSGVAGLSEESRFINNPFLLIDLDTNAYYANRETVAECDESYPQPTSLIYDTQERIFTAYYDVSTYYNKIIQLTQRRTPQKFLFGGRNAIDFGFQYGFLSQQENINFDEPKNISTEVYQFQDFIHVGGSCRYPGGCNNGSPLQTFLNFTFQNLPAFAEFKLWKKLPSSPSTPADVTVKMYFN